MSGAVLNLISEGSGSDYHVLGNGRDFNLKSLFKSSYKKPFNYGMQKFRLDEAHNTALSSTKPNDLRFVVNHNNSDLLLDTHLVVALPNIWSPIHAEVNDGAGTPQNRWRPFEFKWIQKLGANIIDYVEIVINNIVVQKFDGYYLQNVVEREFSEEKKKQFYEMIGHVPELNDPASVNGGFYPNASHKDAEASRGELGSDIEPSIRSRLLVIPLLGWYSFSSKQAVPLCCFPQQSKGLMYFNVRLRPLREWYVVKPIEITVNDETGNWKNYPLDHAERTHISPSSNASAVPMHYQLRRFTKEPPKKAEWESNTELSSDIPDYTQEWLKEHYSAVVHDMDVHIMTTNAVLTSDERDAFKSAPKEYLFKQVCKYELPNAPLDHKYRIDNAGLVANVTIFFQRNDVVFRNEFSNYTNWEYAQRREPVLVSPASKADGSLYHFGPGNAMDLRRSASGLGQVDNLFRTTGMYVANNERHILKHFHMVLSGKIRESHFEASVVSNIEQFTKCRGGATVNSHDVNFYSFELDAGPNNYPSGVLNADFFSKFELAYSLNVPPVDPDAKFKTICDTENNVILATFKDMNGNYKYMYNMYVYVERYNKLTFDNNEVNLSMMY
jgi:hypothetical protein